MTITCLQENLNAGLQTVQKAISTRAPGTETQNVLIRPEQGRLQLTATNLEMSITSWIGAQIEVEEAFMLPAKSLADFVRTLPPEPISLTSSGDQKLFLSCGLYKSEFNTLPVADFPPVPQVQDEQIFKLSAQPLKATLGRVTFAASSDMSRPILSGVKFELDSDGLRIASADGYRLATESVKSITTDGDASVNAVIPAEAIRTIASFIGDHDNVVELALLGEGTGAVFRIGDSIELTTLLLQGEYPDYRRLIPQNHTSTVRVDARPFSEAVDSAAVFARDGNQIIRMITGKNADGDASGSLKVNALAEGLGECNINLQATVEADGEAPKIAFNYRYLTELLREIASNNGTIILQMTSSSGAGVFRYEENKDESNGYTHVIMPMYVQW